ncbi:MAG: AraC family transcriptional regulator [Shinella sp.]|nr:MAG: AraC family transcriptional regulator [Shinella sp.]
MTFPFNPFQEIVSIAARHVKGSGDTPTPIGNVILSQRTQPSEPCHGSYRPCLALVLQGKKSVRLGAETIHYGRGDYLVTSLDLPVAWRIAEASEEAPHLCFSMIIDNAMLTDLLKRVDAPRPVRGDDGRRGMAVNAATPEILDAAVRLLRLLDRPEDIAAMAPLLQQEILYRVLTGPDGGRLLNIAIADSCSNRVAKAVAWLKDNFAEPLRIEDLAERVNMSVSSFHHHFKEVTAMTPVQYQKRLRLHEARRLMMVERLDVASAGFSVGYRSPSQFTREYGRLYGLSPARDMEAGGVS